MNDGELRISKNKQAHMFGVAQFMYDEAPKYGLDPNKMYVVGLLHDIGYLIDGWKDHEKNGALLMHQMGFKYDFEILAHSWLPDKYGITEEDLSTESLLLMAADSCVDSHGERGTYESRRKNIETTYGDDRDYYLERFDRRVNFLKEKGFDYFAN